MSFFNNLGQKISDVSQTTIKKTKDLADTAKLNLNISEEERKIDTAYEQIGKWYVEKHREDAEEDVKTWLDAIAASEANRFLHLLRHLRDVFPHTIFQSVRMQYQSCVLPRRYLSLILQYLPDLLFF